MNKNYKTEYPEIPESFHRAVNKAVNSLDEKAVIPERKKSPFRVIALVAAVFVLLTVSAFGADKVYDYFVKLDNHKVTIQPDESSNATFNSPEYVRLEFGYMPEYIDPFDAPYKFSVKTETGENAASGLTFQLFKADLAKKLEIFYVGSVTECRLGENKGAILKIDTGIESDRDCYDKEFLIYFEEYGYILRCYVSERINEDEMIKIAENISLVESDKENAFIVDTYIPTIDNNVIMLPSADAYTQSAEGTTEYQLEEFSVIS